MKRFWIEYASAWMSGPMSFWVHKHLDGDAWSSSTQFVPPLPKPVPGRGYPKYFVEFRDVCLQFASVDEIRACIDTLERRVLPTTRALSLVRGTTRGPNSHWLSRLPGALKPWSTRRALTAYLRTILAKLDVDPEPSSPGDARRTRVRTFGGPHVTRGSIVRKRITPREV